MYHSLSIVAFLLFISCSESREDLIKNEFENYIQVKIDNPQTLREIISVTATDTITQNAFEDASTLLHERFALTEETDSIFSVQNENLNSKLLSVYSRLGNSEKRAIFNLLKEAQSLSLAEREWLITNGRKKESLETSIDSILKKMNDLYLIEYEIKTRFDENGELGLKMFYALEDSNSIRFFNHKPVFKDYSETAGVFYQVAKEFEEWISARQNLLQLKMENLKKTQLVVGD